MVRQCESTLGDRTLVPADRQASCSLSALHEAVSTFVNETQEMLWSDVTTKLKEVSASVQELTSACNKMPMELRKWDAYAELKGRIDDFALSMPLVEMLSHPSMRERAPLPRELTVTAHRMHVHVPQ